MKSASLFSHHLLIKRLTALAAVGALLMQSSVHGANQTWGANTTGNWSLGSNWVGAAAPGSTSILTNADVATFSNAAGGTITIDSATQNIGGLLFSGTPGAYSIGSAGANLGNSLFLSSGGTINVTSTNAVNQTVNAPLVLAPASATTAGAYTIQNNNTSTGALILAGNITGGTTTQGIALTLAGSNTSASNLISGVIADGTATLKMAVTKSGNGTWTLSGANTYTGATTVSAGTLSLTGSLAGTAITTSGSGILNQSAAGVISGGASFTQGSSGTSILSGVNTYTGATTINAGTLNLGGSTATGSLTSTVLNLGGGTLSYTRTGNTTQAFTTTNLNSGASTITAVAGNTITLGAITPNAGGTVNFGNTGTITTSTANSAGILGGWATFNGTTWAVANGAGSAITGLATYTTTTAAGTTASNYTNNHIDVTNSAGLLGGVITANSLRFNTAAATTVTLATGTNTLGSSGILVTSTVGNNLSTITGGNLTAAASTNLAVIQNNTSNGLTIGSGIANNGTTGLTKSGAGLLTLTGTNTYTGSTTVNAGTLALTGTAILGDSTAVVVNAGTFNITNVTSSETIGSLAGRAGSSVVLGAKNLTVGGDNTSTTFSGVISGIGGSLTKEGTGTLTLDTAQSSFTGGTIVNGGTLTLGAYGTLATGSTLTVNTGATVKTSGANVFGGSTQDLAVLNINGGTVDLSIGGFQNHFWNTQINMTGGLLNFSSSTSNEMFTNVITVISSANQAQITAAAGGAMRLRNSANITFNVGDGAQAVDLLVDAPITNGGGNGLIKSGAGTMQLTKANTYSGATVISAGTLSLTGSLTGGGAVTTSGTGILDQSAAGVISGASTFTQNSSGTSILAGVNTFTGTTTVSAGALNLSGNRTATSGAFSVGDTAGSTGTLNISNGTFTTGTFQVGNAASSTAIGIVNQTGGTLTMSGNQLLLGSGNGTTAGSSSSGTYNLSAGTLNTIAGSLGVTLGTNTGTTGTFNLSGTGSLAMPATSTLQIGRSDNSGAATNTTGTFAQTGGTATVGILQMGGSNAGGGTNNAGTNAILTLTGGTFTATTFNQLSGGNASTSTINIGGTAVVTLPAFPTALGTSSTATLNFDGGTLKNSAASANYLGSVTSAFIKAGGAQFDTASGSITITQALQTHGVSTGGGLTKIGANTLTLSGTSTYTGATTISAGTLALGNGGNLGATAVTINSGITLAVAQNANSTSNAITGSIALNAGSTFTMGDTFASTLNVTGASTLAAASGASTAMTFDIVGAAADQLAITGAATVGAAGAQITIAPSSTTITPGNFTLITAASGLGTNFSLASSVLQNVGGLYNLSLASSTATAEIVTVTADANALYWSGASSGDWNTAGNWNTGVSNSIVSGSAPGSTTNVAFSTTTPGPLNLTNSLSAPLTVNSVTFLPGAAAVTVSGSALTLNAGGINNASANAQTITAPVTLGAAQTWTNNAAGLLTVGGNIDNGSRLLTVSGTGNTTISGNIGSGATKTGGLTMNGTGILTLTGINTNSGTTTINSGKLLYSRTNTTSDYASTGAYSIASGATLEINATAGARFNTSTSQFTGAGTFVKSGVGRTFLTAGASTQTFNMSAGALIDVQAGILDTSAQATNLATLNIATGAQLLIANTDAITTLQFDALTGGGTLNMGGAGTRTVVIGANGGSGTFSGVIGNTGTISLTKTGAGTQILTGTNTYTGTTTISAGTLQVGIGGAAGSLGTGPVVNNASLIYNRSDGVSLSATTGTGTLSVTAGTTVTLGGDINLSGSQTYTTGIAGQNGLRIVNNQTFTASAITITGQIGELNGSNGNRTLTLNTSAANGPITLNLQNGSAGNLYGVGINANAGTGALTISGANVGTSAWNGALGNTFRGALNIASSFTTSTLALTATAASSVSGNLTLSANTHTFTTDPGVTMAISGILSGTSANITKAGTGTVTLTGANTYTGTTTLSAGTLNLGVAESVNVSGPLGKQLANAAGTIILNGGTLQYSASNSNDYSGRFSTAASQAYDVDTNGQSVTWATALTSSGGALTKSGAGTLTLSGANTYSGTTTVSAGALQVGSGGVGTTGTGAVTVQTGSTILGTGVVRGPSFTAQSGSTVQAGDGTAQGNYGTLNITPVSGSGSFDFQSGSTTILGINPGGTSDLLNFVGTGSNTLLFNGNLTVGPASFTPTMAETFNLLDWSGLASTPTFASRYSSVGLLTGNGDEASGLDLPNISGSGFIWDISQFTTNGTIAIVVVPEPSRALLMMLGVIAALPRRRRVATAA